MLTSEEASPRNAFRPPGHTATLFLRRPLLTSSSNALWRMPMGVTGFPRNRVRREHVEQWILRSAAEIRSSSWRLHFIFDINGVTLRVYLNGYTGQRSPKVEHSRNTWRTNKQHGTHSTSDMLQPKTTSDALSGVDYLYVATISQGAALQPRQITRQVNEPHYQCCLC